jgi:hypothetical protein
MFRVRRSFANCRLKDYAKTAGSQRAVPLRERVVNALEEMPVKRRGMLFLAPEGGRVEMGAWGGDRNLHAGPADRQVL